MSIPTESIQLDKISKIFVLRNILETLMCYIPVYKGGDGYDGHTPNYQAMGNPISETTKDRACPVFRKRGKPR